jgi:hypothetical protein
MRVAIVKSSELTAEKGLNANKYIPPTKEEIQEAYVLGWKSAMREVKRPPEWMELVHERILQVYLAGRRHATRELKKLEKKMNANAECIAKGLGDENTSTL